MSIQKDQAEEQKGVFRYNLSLVDGGPVVAAVALLAPAFTEGEADAISVVMAAELKRVIAARSAKPMPAVPNRASRRRMARFRP